jgi:hypothetical protein
MVRLRQNFERTRVEDVSTSVRDALDRLDLGRVIRPGQSVALTAGSRGIANIPVILRAVVRCIRDLGAGPFLVPAMGSHGGGTAEGQRAVLESYGITEAFVGAPIRASMDVVSLGTTPEDFAVVLDRYAAEADHVGVVARIKPHTAYHGPIESGLLKMMMIGLGKHAGAYAYHRLLLDHPYDQVVRSVGRLIRAKGRIAFGLGLVENAYEETALVEAALPGDFESVEERLLVHARRWLPRLPWREVDLLVIDEIGKEISGSGMDTNVVGRKRAFANQEPENQPRMRFIFVRGLSAHTHGNAAGIGFADFTTARLVRAMDYRATVLNCTTSGYPSGANLPVHFDSDREVIDTALSILGTRAPEDARIMHVRNTLALENLEVSEPCLQHADRQTDFAVESAPCELAFDDDGNLAAVGAEMHRY